jgi:hypothetical protein
MLRSRGLHGQAGRRSGRLQRWGQFIADSASHAHCFRVEEAQEFVEGYRLLDVVAAVGVAPSTMASAIETICQKAGSLGVSGQSARISFCRAMALAITFFMANSPSE